MLKRLLIAALMWPLLAFGQSYPSPTFNNLTVNGTFTATGKVGLASLAAQAANTVVANVTASSASPTAVAIPSCSTANSALQYTSGTGLSCGASFALTSGTLAQFSATTSAQLQGVVSDETGTGSLVFGTGPTISTPAISGGTVNSASVGATTPSTGAFTTLSASSTVSGTGFSTYLASPPAIGGTAPNTGKFTTLQATGAITPSSTAGIVGTTTNDNANAGSVGEYVTATGTGVSLSNGVLANITSISLTAGDWDVGGNIVYSPSATMTNIVAGASSTSATLPAAPMQSTFAVSGEGVASIVAPLARFSLTSTTTVYLVGGASFASGTCTATGIIRARRVR